MLIALTSLPAADCSTFYDLEGFRVFQIFKKYILSEYMVYAR